MDIGVTSLLVEGSLPPEASHPSEAIVEVFIITAENKRGNRYELDNFGTQNKAQADRQLAKIEAHLAKGGKLNLDHWSEREPVYGSDAYCEEYGF